MLLSVDRPPATPADACPVPVQEEESLAHQIKCFENTPQASQINMVANKVGAGSHAFQSGAEGCEHAAC